MNSIAFLNMIDFAKKLNLEVDSFRTSHLQSFPNLT